MKNVLSEIFANTAQVKIILTLAICPLGLPLRLLSRVSQCELRSTQLVVKSLLEKKLLKKNVIERTVLYKLNENHEWMPLIESIVTQQSNFQIKKRSKLFAERANRQFEFCKQAMSFISQ